MGLNFDSVLEYVAIKEGRLQRELLSQAIGDDE
jgi:hypothetical protein